MKNSNINKIPIGITVLILVIIGTIIFTGFSGNNKSYEIIPESKTSSSSHLESSNNSDNIRTGNRINESTSDSTYDLDSASATNYKRLDIKQPNPITQKLVFSQSKESQIKEIKINAEYEGTYAFTLTEVYNGTYFDLYLCNEYGDKCSNSTTIDYPGTSNKGVEYDDIKPGQYTLKVCYNSGSPSCLLTIYKANKIEDISGYLDCGIITDCFSAPWMRNYYTISVKENSVYCITTECGEYFEIDILDKYGNRVKFLNGLQDNTEIELNSGEYTLDIHCCSTSQPYSIKIMKE